MEKHYCKKVIARDKNDRIISIMHCDFVYIDFSDVRNEYTISLYKGQNDISIPIEYNEFIGNIFCNKYELE